MVRNLLADISACGAGQNYLIQHSAGSGKSNSIAWTTYRLASLHGQDDQPVFSSVVVVTDRTMLDAQLQETISGFDHTQGAVETIGENKPSEELYQQNAYNKLKMRSEKFQYPDNGRPTQPDQDARCASQERWELPRTRVNTSPTMTASCWPPCGRCDPLLKK